MIPWLGHRIEQRAALVELHHQRTPLSVISKTCEHRAYESDSQASEITLATFESYGAAA